MELKKSEVGSRKTEEDGRQKSEEGNHDEIDN